jgi:antitoxin (DNA-binding transcriptional repressor) of toxin-antitoxin stability system
VSSSFLEEVPAATLTRDTIRRLYELIDKAKTDPKFQELVYSITKGLPSKDYRGELAAILRWAKKNIRYTRDPYGVELVQDVWATLSRERADCDDFDVLVGAMVEVMGAPVRLVTVSTRQDKEPVHTYPAANVGGKWIALDATVPSSSPGWEPRRITDKKIWSRKDVGMSGYDEENVEGLGMFKSSVREVNLTPGVPNDIAHTYADMMPGTQVDSKRPQPGAPLAIVARFSDLPESPAPGNLPYNPSLRIRPFPLPRNIWSRVPRNSVPININAWPNDVKPWKRHWDDMLPQANVPEDKYMTNLGAIGECMGGLNLGALDTPEANALVNAVAADTRAKVASGKVHSSDAADHARRVIDAVRTGDASTVGKNPKTAATVVAIAKRKPKEVCGLWSDPSLNWLPRSDGLINGKGLGEYTHLTLSGLGQDDMDDLSNAINQDVVQQVAQGSVPKSAAPAVAAKIVDALSTGDTNVLKSTPKTVAAARRISSKNGNGRKISTPATRAHHPTTAHTTRRDGSMRDSSADYFEQDESTEFIPMMYGLNSRNRGALYQQVHRLVKERLPKAAAAAGVKPAHLRKVFGRKASLQGLGDTVDPSTTTSAATAITSSIMGVVDPADAAAVSKAVNAGISAIVGAAPTATPGISDYLKGWGVPLLVLAAITGIGMYMKKPKRTISYRRNGSRRRSRGGRGGGKGIGKYVPWIIGGGAAYLLLSTKASTAVPGGQPVSLLQSALNLFKPTAAGAPSPVTGAVTNLFSSIFGTSKPAPAPAPAVMAFTPPASATPSNPSGMVFESDIAPPAPTYDNSSMVIDLES